MKTCASFAENLKPHETLHVDALGLKSLSNGDLLDYARTNFEVFLTLDRGILHQHRHVGDLRVLVVRTPDSTIESLLTRLEDILQWLDNSQPGDRDEI